MTSLEEKINTVKNYLHTLDKKENFNRIDYINTGLDMINFYKNTDTTKANKIANQLINKMEFID